MSRRFKDPKVAEVFESYPASIRPKMLALRELIFETAAHTQGVGELEETLKWGEPAYVTSQTKSGSTIRIDSKESNPERYAVYFHCQTNLVGTFRTVFRDQFRFEGNRAIIFDREDSVPAEELALCISAALTYHLNKKSGRKRVGKT